MVLLLHLLFFPNDEMDGAHSKVGRWLSKNENASTLSRLLCVG